MPSRDVHRRGSPAHASDRLPDQNTGADTAFDFEVPKFFDTFTTNILGPAHLSQTLLPLIEKSEKKFILNYSSGLGSIGLDLGTKCMTYSVSKTAVNMLVRTRSRSHTEWIVDE